MKTKLIVLGLVPVLLSACSLFSTNESSAEFVQIGNTVTGAQPVILLQHPTTGKLACCRDTEDVTAEECARALEEECFVRVQDLPYRPAEYDFLTTDTYPTRRWRENEKAPRW